MNADPRPTPPIAAGAEAKAALVAEVESLRERERKAIAKLAIGGAPSQMARVELANVRRRLRQLGK